jgi:hypothetical protein
MESYTNEFLGDLGLVFFRETLLPLFDLTILIFPPFSQLLDKTSSISVRDDTNEPFEDYCLLL